MIDSVRLFGVLTGECPNTTDEDDDLCLVFCRFSFTGGK